MVNLAVAALESFSFTNALEDAQVVKIGYHLVKELETMFISALASRFQGLASLFESRSSCVESVRKRNRGLAKGLETLHGSILVATVAKAVAMKFENGHG